MFKFKFCFLLSLLSVLVNFASFAQNDPPPPAVDYNDFVNQYSMSNPDVYTFEKYNLTPVNHYVGKQNVSVPVYTIKTGGIEYPISLVYNMGGIKVDQLASDVGLGWSLTKSMITRIVNQDNDFDNTGSLSYQSDANDYTEEDRNNDSKAYQQSNNHKVGYFLQKEANMRMTQSFKSVDFLPDTYKFHSGNYSSSFFFNDINTPIEMNPKGTKITAIPGKLKIPTKRWGYLTSVNGYPVYGYITTLKTKDFFTIIILTNDGIKYTFSDYDLSYTEKFKVGTNHALENRHDIVSPAQISAWHITKIEDTKTGKKIDFVYENTSSNPNDFGPFHLFHFKGAQKSYSFSTIPIDQSLTGCHYYAPWDDGRFLVSGSARIDVQKKRLKKIIFDEGEVDFNYNHEGIGSASGIGRPDIYNGDFLTQIYLKDSHLKTVRSFSLSYSQFISDYGVGEFNTEGEVNPYRYNRLKLLSFQEEGKPAYKFSYEESIKLPPVNSFSVDFAGYYNNSPDIHDYEDIITNRKSPKLYYYPNQFEKSLLPFPVAGMSYTTIPGYFNREANDFAKAWSLNKVEYPTGGSSEYVYESNDFEIFGQTVKGGGIRIAKQILKDGSGGLREINYSYLKSNGKTSGKMPSIPYFGHPTVEFFNVTESVEQEDHMNMEQFDIVSPPGTTTNILDWKLCDKSNLNADITSGAYVEYSRSVEKENNNGWREFLYTSNDLPDFQNKYYRAFGQYSPNIFSLKGVNPCIGRFVIANSGFGTEIFTDNSYKRGRLLEENTFNEANQIVSKTKIEYTDFLINNTYDFHQVFSRPLHILNENNLNHFITAGKRYKIAQFLPVKKTITDYDGTGLEKKVISDFTYNTNGLIKTISTTNSNGDVKMNKYYYANDVISVNSLPGGVLTPLQESMYKLMARADKNDIAQKIQTEDYTNNVIDATIRNTFIVYDFMTNSLLPESVKTSTGTNPLDNKYTISKYEKNPGNPVEISQENGIKTVFIWGYKKTKLIAKLVNVDYASIPPATITELQTLSDVDTDNCKNSGCKEQELRVKLAALRGSFPNAMVTTYTYDPLVGTTSITDPRGYTVYYEYDSLNRLIHVKDSDGKIMSKNEYNFHNN